MILDDVDKVKESVKDYYGKRFKIFDDFQINVCKFGDNLMIFVVKNVLKFIYYEVFSK